MTNWFTNISALCSTLESLSIFDEVGKELKTDLAFVRWVDLTIRAREAGKTLYFIGNGASASMASHFAADLAKNGNMHTQVFSDLSLITAIANDMSYEEVFVEPLRRRMTNGDVLVAISSSGESPNVLKAAREAPTLGGLVVTLSAMRSDNALRQVGKLNFYVPAETYGLAETCHAAILHFWVDKVIKRTVQK